MKLTNWANRLLGRSRETRAAPAASAAARAASRIEPAFVKTAEMLDAEFQQQVIESGLPAALSSALLKRGRQNQSPADAITYATSVRDACFAAGSCLESLAPDFVRAGTSIKQVRMQLLDAKAEDQELVTALPAASAARSAPTLNADSIYEKRRRE